MTSYINKMDRPGVKMSNRIVGGKRVGRAIQVPVSEEYYRESGKKQQAMQHYGGLGT